MFVRAYLRASTVKQDAQWARQALERFSAEHGRVIAAGYVENASGARFDRPELLRLLNDARPGDVLLLESIDTTSVRPAARSHLRASGTGGDRVIRQSTVAR